MATRSRAVDIGEGRARATIARVATEARLARVSAGLSQRDVARALHIDRSQYSRIERGLSPDLSLRTASRLCAVLGLELSVRTYPVGDPIRDAAQVALLERLMVRCHPTMTWRTEVPLPIPGDRRAWDATISMPGWAAGIEAETALTDVQALDRRLALKERDGGLGRMLLLMLDSRRNRAALRAGGEFLRLRFPVDSRVALRALAAGLDPGGNALIML